MGYHVYGPPPSLPQGVSNADRAQTFGACEDTLALLVQEILW
jgi:hypothetical protein